MFSSVQGSPSTGQAHDPTGEDTAVKTHGV